MGLCCSSCCDVYCTKCGCPHHHYNDNVHASRKSCRGINGVSRHTEYHSWKYILF